jgi:putative tricarboxylic transport membrane protein
VFIVRILFSGFFLLFAIVFTIKSFDYTFVNQQGEVGAGFFPRWIGFLLILTAGYSVYKDLKLKAVGEKFNKKHVRDLIKVMAVTLLFISLFTTLGALLSMGAYIFSLLLILNRGRVLQNILLSVLFPTGLYLLFNVWLNAGLPKGSIFTMF